MICCLIHPNDVPRGSSGILLHLDDRRARDLGEAHRILDTIYDRVRHRFASFLCQRPGNAAFKVDDPSCVHGANFQVAFVEPLPYDRVVTQLNKGWVAHRDRLAQAVARR